VKPRSCSAAGIWTRKGGGGGGGGGGGWGVIVYSEISSSNKIPTHISNTLTAERPSIQRQPYGTLEKAPSTRVAQSWPMQIVTLFRITRRPRKCAGATVQLQKSAGINERLIN